MSRNGSGSYSLPAGNPVVTGATISSTTHNNTMSDIATALTDSLAKDGQTTPTANLPMNGYKHTGVGDASARTDYAKVSQVQDGGYMTLSSVSGADTITATVAPSIAAYAAGQFFTFTSAGANTGAVTLNINSLGAKAVTKEGTTALAAGDIASGSVVNVQYDGTRFQLTSGRSVQPLDSDLTAIAALTTTTYGRALLELADAAALRTAVGSATTTTVGLVEKATQAEAEAGTDDTVFPSALGVKQAIAARSFSSDPQTITSGGSLTLAHGLSSTPTLVQVWLKCIDASGEHGYSQNDLVPVNFGTTYTVASGVSLVPDATNVNVRFSNSAGVFILLNKTTGSAATATNTKWNLIVRAWYL
jgi:hypothetical protein